MDLRPHHLLCTQGYSGKGYSEEFVKHMDRLVEQLRGDVPVTVRLCFSTDDLCSHCPNKLGDNLCSTNEKVQRFDRKTAEYFQLEEKEYIYQELIEQIQSQATPEILEDICRGCCWYPVSACKTNILKKYRPDQAALQKQRSTRSEK